MLLKSASRNPSPIGMNVKRMISKTPTNPRTQSPSLKKKFTPVVNKSFTCYKEKIPSKHIRTSSLDKNKENLSAIRRSKNRSLKISIKGLNQTKECSLESAKFEMESNNYSKAIDILNQISNPDKANLEIVYNKAVCNMHLKQYKLAIEDFLTVLETNPIYDKQLYVALYMCYLSINQPLLAIRFLSKGLRKFPNFVQGYIMRGQLLIKLKKYEKAIKDFKRTLNMDKHNNICLLYIAECFLGLKDFKSALEVLDLAISKPEIIRKTLILRSKVFYQLEKYDDCLSDLDKILEHWPEETMAFYYKAKINYEMKNYSEAALCFEQVIKGSDDIEIMNSSVFLIGSIKIKEKDFYGALHTFERAIKSQVTPDQKVIHLYTEGVICLMKRKLDEGINIFNGLLKSTEKSIQEYLGNCFENLGFAYFSQSKYEKSLNMLNLAKKHMQISKSSEFNQLICEAIIANTKSSGKALKILKNCKAMFPKNPMPEIGRACILMHQSFKSEEYFHMLIKAELLIDNIYKSREPESEVLFYRSILKFCLKNYDSAYENAKKAIEKADENLPKNYVHRGYCQALLKKYDEAVQDFTIALQLNDDQKNLYVYRGIAAFLQDDLQLAFDDFTFAAKKYSKDPVFSFKLSRLLCIIGSYNDSLSLLDEKLVGISPFEIEILRSRNFICLQNFEKALECLKLVQKPEIKSKNLETDKEILEFFIEVKKNNSKVFNSVKFCTKIKENPGTIFTKKYLYWIIGILLFYSKDFVSASSYFQGVLEILHNEEPEIFADTITIEEENCEILYNLALCSLISGTEEVNSHALMIFEELAEVLNTKHRGQLLFLSSVIELTRKNTVKAEKLLKEAQKCDSETVSPYLENKATTVLPLHTSSEFASIFPLVPIVIEGLPIINVRPSVVLPRIELDVTLQMILDEVTSLYTINSITPRPEAPWLNRNNGSIQFTDNLIQYTQEYKETEKSSHRENDSEKEIDEASENSKDALKRKTKSQSIVRDLTDESNETEIKEVDEDSEKFFEQKIKFFCNE